MGELADAHRVADGSAFATAQLTPPCAKGPYMAVRQVERAEVNSSVRRDPQFVLFLALQPRYKQSIPCKCPDTIRRKSATDRRDSFTRTSPAGRSARHGTPSSPQLGCRSVGRRSALPVANCQSRGWYTHDNRAA